METNETLKLFDDIDFLDKIYHFSYHRCNTSFEAEDLCSDIVLAVISAIHKQEHIESFYAFVWTIARRVYADYCKNRNAERQVVSIENSDLILASKENEIDDFIEEAAEQEQISRIFKEIAFLSKAYREVMIMFYIDELKVKDIAAKLNITETTVKQRLFSARNSIRKEVTTMDDRTYVLKPVKLTILGTGNPCGNDPRSKAERMFSQNLIYLCKDKPKSAIELSQELCVPMPYIEEELEIQCHGENGKYGMLRKLDNGKYAVNIHLVDYDEYDRANQIYEKHLPEFCKVIKTALKQNEEKILSFPFLSEQKDLRFIMWSLISRTVWDFEERINKVLAEKYFFDVTPIKRNFSCVAVAYTDEQKPAFDFYGSDGIDATSVGGYKFVFVSNIYGKRIDEHFHCGHNLSHDQKLLMVLRSIGGISIDELTEEEKEIAAKALECGYLRKIGNMIEPKIIVIDRKNYTDFYNLSFDFNNDMGTIIDQIAAELSVFMRSHIPEHLMNEYQLYTELIAGVRILSKTIEECIEEEILSEPQSRVGAEGVLMIVEK
ncbi:MAG: sigma-70 family RNA polymerase sigma factor [Eubacteriales bacterium]|nr:sigma-70 family RNA polymerase sigma factor [Eubacteriales bacterium]